MPAPPLAPPRSVHRAASWRLVYHSAVRWIAALWLVGGCSFRPGSLSADASVFDSHPFKDAPVDAPDGCDGEGSFTICLATMPTSALDLPMTTIDTTACSEGQLIDPKNGGPMLCVLAGTTVIVSGAVRGIGMYPLAIVAHTGDLAVQANASVDVSSSHDGMPGAGANDSGCTASPKGHDDNNGGGGGAGGSFGGAGGDGGTAAGAGGGAAMASGAPTWLRGGCPGGDGGSGMGTGGRSGDGGGAVYLVARGGLVILGTVDASGGGARTTQANKDGGGGGGSGGMIVLSAAQMTASADVFANGGGGAGGAEMSNGQPGRESSGATSPAAGGAGGGNSGDGGPGAIGTQPGGPGNSGSKGGGGGGGGVGVIRVLTGSLTGGGVSPPPS